MLRTVDHGDEAKKIFQIVGLGLTIGAASVALRIVGGLLFPIAIHAQLIAGATAFGGAIAAIAHEDVEGFEERAHLVGAIAALIGAALYAGSLSTGLGVGAIHVSTVVLLRMYFID
jgi:hypothetical protein